MSGDQYEPHNHTPEVSKFFDTSIYVKHGDTGKHVSKRGPFLQYRLRRAARIVKGRHDRGTARERRVRDSVEAVRQALTEKHGA